MPVCGNRSRHADGKPVAHASVDAVRACCLDTEAWACQWLLAAHQQTEHDGQLAPQRAAYLLEQLRTAQALATGRYPKPDLQLPLPDRGDRPQSADHRSHCP